MGFFTKEAMHAIATTTLQNAKDFENGEKLVNVVK
jgi:lactate dehydrogenase-like 2-hydroxyacid dehydrogenase